MATIKDSLPIQMNQNKIQATRTQLLGLPSTNSIKIQETNQTPFEPRRRGCFFGKLFQHIFCLHIFLIVILVIFLTIRGLLSAAKNHNFHPQDWYPALLASTGCAALFGFAWLLFTLCNPSRTLKAVFWLSPLLTCAAGVLIVLIGSTGSLVTAVIFLLSAFIQSLYSCWVNRRLEHAARVLSVSLSFSQTKITALISLWISISTVYSCFLVVGIGGATATGTGLEILFISIILLSLTWTMHVVKNILQVTISHVKYMHFASGMDVDTKLAFHTTITHSMESVCTGSILVPVLGVIRGSARAISLIAGDTDEFLFSCVHCYSALASRLVMLGNRWAFVYVGVYNKGFVQASTDTWEMYKRIGLEPLIDNDLTSSFCFLCGVAAGAVCTLVAGSWTLAVHKSYATEVSIYAFLIGYFISRISMAWPQASVSAYYVAYAENPQNQRFDSTIPDRIQELQRLDLP